MKSIILSFDYELFFGDKSGTVEQSLIIPTYKLLDCMESLGFRGNFFVDWQMLKYLKETGEDKTDLDYNLIVKQLKDIIRRGHRIELHIHPHWIDAKYNGDGTWDFSDFSHYSLSSFKEEEIIKMFNDGSSLLTAIAREVDPSYTICAFRAGGWAIQPFSSMQNAFKKAGIIIDSSVMRGAHANNEYSYYDFRDAPITQSGFYHFNDDVCREEKNGQFIEVPISSVKITFFCRIMRRVYRLFKPIVCLTDGTHIRLGDPKANKTGRTKFMVLSFSTIDPISALYNELSNSSNITCYIDHPKDFTNNTESCIKAISLIRKKSLFYYDLIYN